jgi:sec-independent protein translocase protein TatA
MPNLRWQELLIIVALVLLLFGAKRLPDAARGLGRSMRIFKAETKGLVDGSEESSLHELEPTNDDDSHANAADASGVPDTSEAPDRSRTDG